VAAETDTQKLIEHLQGTCLSLEQACEQLGIEVDDVDTEALDNELFLCAQCDWWCEISEASDDPDWNGDLCEDCAPEEDD
jgi:hypothetical protein